MLPLHRPIQFRKEARNSHIESDIREAILSAITWAELCNMYLIQYIIHSFIKLFICSFLLRTNIW